MNNSVHRGVKRMAINKLFTEREIKKLAKMYPENTRVYNLLSQYCIVPENMYTPNLTQHKQGKGVIITIHQ